MMQEGKGGRIVGEVSFRGSESHKSRKPSQPTALGGYKRRGIDSPPGSLEGVQPSVT